MAITQTAEEANANAHHADLMAWLQAVFAANPPTYRDGSTDAIRDKVAGLAAGISQHVHPTMVLPREGRYGNVAAAHVDMNANVQHAIRYLTHNCNGHWTEAQAIGIVANLIHESGCNPHGPNGDGNQAMGLCQWHADRRANFEAHFHKRFEDSTFDDQLAFINFEMTEGKEQKAGNLLRQCKDARDAAAVVTTYYERPADIAGDSRVRAATAAGLANKFQDSDTGPAVAMPIEQRLKQFNVAIGDSIAVAAHLAGVPTLDNSAVQNRSPQAVLNYIKALPKGSLKGKNVLLSTGISNDPKGLQLAEQQVDALLLDVGAASVTVLGVGPRADLKPLNDKIEKMLEGKHGVAFSGALQGTGSDEVHPGTPEQQLAMVDNARSVMPTGQTQTAAADDPRVPKQQATNGPYGEINSAQGMVAQHVPPTVSTPATVANNSGSPRYPDYKTALADKPKPDAEKTASISKSPGIGGPTAAA